MMPTANSGDHGKFRFDPTVGDDEWLRVTLGSIGDAVVTTDLQGRVSFLNPEAERLTGWTLADASGKPLDEVFRIINEDTRRTVDNPATRALREGVVVGLANHTLLIARDGVERPIDDSAAPIRNHAGLVAGVVLVFRDVTERRRSEIELRESEERFRLLVEGVQDYAIFSLDPEGHIASWNLGAERIKLYAAHEIIGRHFSVFYPAEDLLSGKPEHELVTAADVGRFEDEGWRLRKDGTRFWANVVITAMRDSLGRLRGYTKITRDLTARKLTEDRLRSSEQRLRLVIQSSLDAIISGDMAGNVIGWNEAATRLFGYTADEILGKALTQLMPERYRAAHAAGLARLVRTGQSSLLGRLLELFGLRKDGTEFPVELSLSSASTNEERFFTAIVRDVSQRRQAEEDRLRLELASAQAGAMTDLNRSKDEFLAMLSHELRNPLAAIVNMVQVLRLREDDVSARQQARVIIERQVSQLAMIVDQLLEVSRITTGKVRLHTELYDLRTSLQLAADVHRPFIVRNHQTLQLSMPPDPIWVHADSRRIEQVITNLLSNATKYCRPGGTIELSLREEAGQAVLGVRDDGIGISAEMLPRVFDLFAQGDQALDRAEGGLGVGLTVVKRIVELHAGSVQARSAGLGQGSEFLVRLRRAEAANQERDRSGTVLPAFPGPLQILVVDDNHDAANSTAMMLRLSGHEVRVAYSGATALVAAEGSPPDVALIDIAMPGMDGHELARRFRAEPRFSHVRLIAISGFGLDVDRQRSRAAGFDDHLVKPVPPERLDAALIQQMSES
jgi:PAS domain S-box-containing protein